MPRGGSEGNGGKTSINAWIQYVTDNQEKFWATSDIDNEDPICCCSCPRQPWVPDMYIYNIRLSVQNEDWRVGLHLLFLFTSTMGTWCVYAYIDFKLFVLFCFSHKLCCFCWPTSGVGILRVLLLSQTNSKCKKNGLQVITMFVVVVVVGLYWGYCVRCCCSTLIPSIFPFFCVNYCVVFMFLVVSGLRVWAYHVCAVFSRPRPGGILKPSS